MKSKAVTTIQAIIPVFFLLVVAFGTAATFSKAAQQSGQGTAASSQPAQKVFSTPKEASEALIQAAETFDQPALKEILGRDGEDLVASGDPVQDKTIAAAFAAKPEKKMRSPWIPRILAVPS